MIMSKRYRDEDDVRVNNSRQFGASNKARPRTKDRPDYSAAQTGRIIEVDRGRVKCLITGSQSLSQNGEPLVVNAMKARELGKKSVVVGDLVSVVGDLSGTEGTLARVVTVLDRKNSLTRTIDDHVNDERVIVANVDQMGIVIASANPEPREGFVDRALVVAFDQGIKPIIIMTKQDLADGTDFLSTYKDLEITLFKIDKSSDLTQLSKTLADKTTVLLGHSGVGKSTLVNKLLGNERRATGDVNDVTGRGRHTSSSAIALALPHSGWIIDTPGVRSFGVAHVEPTRVISAFAEFSEAVQHCPKNCSHNEESCALNNWPDLSPQNLARLASLRRVLSTKQ
ncbi:MAG: ribosome small subunit-dependent GTPase A [Actinobacteria bacterium]|nr:ribosome small subunit-dependent GTPase A [Actinomycetota bacterium]